MKSWAANHIGVEQGDIQLFADFKDDGPMWAGSGERERRRFVEFNGDFKSIPAVHVSFSLLDLHQATNPRLELATENVTEEGFEIVFRTWGDSRLARVRVAWMAIGEMRHPDDWDVD